MQDTRNQGKTPPKRAEVTRRFGYPWPWQHDSILRSEWTKREGTDREIGEKLGELFGCHRETVLKRARQLGLTSRSDP